MIRVALCVAAIGLIFLGLWLIGSSFITTTPTSPGPSPVVAVAPKNSANPVALGTALLAGGVVFLVMVLRRK
jgi:hypothetical protein